MTAPVRKCKQPSDSGGTDAFSWSTDFVGGIGLFAYVNIDT